MALPSSGNSISLNQVNVELGLSGTTTISMNQTSVRNLFQKASGAISMSDGHGKSNATALTRGFNGVYGSNNVEFTTYVDKVDAYYTWDTFSYNEYFSGAGPITVELRQHIGSTNCNSILVHSETYGSAGTNLTNQYVGVNNYYCDNDIYLGGGSCKKAGYYHVVVSNPNSTIKLGTWVVEYGYEEQQCNCPWYCGTTQVCNACDYDCSGDCATGYGAVCECDPGADDWCEPNCPCSPYSCGYSYECNCGEECNYVHTDVYYPCGYGYCSHCSLSSLN